MRVVNILREFTHLSVPRVGLTIGMIKWRLEHSLVVFDDYVLLLFTSWLFSFFFYLLASQLHWQQFELTFLKLLSLVGLDARKRDSCILYQSRLVEVHNWVPSKKVSTKLVFVFIYFITYFFESHRRPREATWEFWHLIIIKQTSK